ncbi:hypothetical protein NXF25_020897 [Crotalus adamanteus]|uniref:Uncharacterized protein n=1 Tax=Crotalus adamanteus TaxID=8729 RepID=A0AAW1B7A0_CROAD
MPALSTSLKEKYLYAATRTRLLAERLPHSSRFKAFKRNPPSWLWEPRLQPAPTLTVPPKEIGQFHVCRHFGSETRLRESLDSSSIFSQAPSDTPCNCDAHSGPEMKASTRSSLPRRKKKKLSCELQDGFGLPITVPCRSSGFQCFKISQQSHQVGDNKN